MRKKIMLIISCMIFSMTLALTVAAAPVEMSANEIEYNSSTEQMIAVGKVVLKRDEGIARAERAEYNVKSERGRLQGNVRMEQGSSTISCEVLDVLSKNHFVAQGSAQVSKDGDSLSAPQISYYEDRKFMETAGGWASLQKNDGSQVQAAHINYDMNQGVAVATDNVKISAPARNLEGAGDKAVYQEDKNNNKNSTITLSGNAWAIQDGNKIVGNRLVFRTGAAQGEATGKVIITIPPEEQGAVKKSVPKG